MNEPNLLTRKPLFEIGKEGMPDLPAMMLSTIEALRALGGSASIGEILDQVVEQEGITEEEQSYTLPNGKDRRVPYYLAWARTYLKRGGALENSARRVWALTESGSRISSRKDTKAIYEAVQAEEREKTRLKRLAGAVEAPDTGVEELSDTPASPKVDWRNELLDVLKAMDPAAFERLSQRLLREAGFVKVEVRGKTGDGGIDGVGVLRVNLVTFQVYFQCKRYTGSVGSKEIRDFRGALQGRADKGLFITTGTFTQQASEEATRDGAIAIDLIDCDRLCDLLKEYQLGVQTELVEQVTITPRWFGDI